MYDLVVIGEMLVDLISTEGDSSLARASTFSAVVGGSPLNAAVTAAHLGGRVAAIGAVGTDALGEKIIAHLGASGVTPLVERTELPTSVAFVSRSTSTPEFVVVRGADRAVPSAEVPDCRWLHTSLFALSEEPLRSTVFNALASAAERDGCVVSVDANYAREVWRDRPLQPTLASLAPLVGVLKASADDCRRMFRGATPTVGAELLEDMGFAVVVVTDGPRPVIVRCEGETLAIPIPAPERVVDVTGAGDAFMAGLAMARLDGLDWRDAVGAGAAVARQAVKQIGAIVAPIDRRSLYAADVA